MKAIRFRQPGGPEVLAWVAAPLADPALGEARIRHTAIGVNYIDVYQRSGAYPVPLPAGLGFEAAGVVEALGSGVTDLAVGQRVAYVDGPAGACAEARNHPASRLVPLPDSIADEVAAALIFKGLTAHMLVKRFWRPEPGAWALVHAAAGDGTSKLGYPGHGVAAARRSAGSPQPGKSPDRKWISTGTPYRVKPST